SWACTSLLRMLRGEGFVVFKRPFRWQECQVWSGCIVAGELAGLLAENPGGGVADAVASRPRRGESGAHTGTAIASGTADGVANGGGEQRRALLGSRGDWIAGKRGALAARSC